MNAPVNHAEHDAYLHLQNVNFLLWDDLHKAMDRAPDNEAKLAILRGGARKLARLEHPRLLDRDEITANLFEAADLAGLPDVLGEMPVNGAIEAGFRAHDHDEPIDSADKRAPAWPVPPPSQGPAAQRIIDDLKARAKPCEIEPTPYRCEDEENLPPRAWLYGHVLLRGCVSLVIAPGGVGKSSLAIVEALAMASGRQLLHDQPYGKSTVWLWNGEEDRVELERRVAAARRHHGVAPEEIGDRLFVDSGLNDGKEIAIARMERNGAIIAEPMRDTLIAAILKRGIDVLIVDPFVSSHGVPENDNNAIDRVVKAYARIAKETGCAILLIHHARKTDGRPIDIEDGRGASALKDGVRAARALNVMSEDEAAKAGVKNRFLHVRINDAKANYAPHADKAQWFRLASITLPNGDDVGVPDFWEWPDAFAGVTAADLLAAQRAVEGGRWREAPQAKEWVGIPIAKALGRDLNRPAERAALRTVLKTWIANGAFVVVTGLDAHREERTYVEVGTWATD